MPRLGESITEATVSKWLKQPGEPVAMDEPVAELETDKVTLEVPHPPRARCGDPGPEGANVPSAPSSVHRRRAADLQPAPHPGPSPRTRGEGGARARPGEDEGQRTLERSGPAVRKLIEETGLDTRRIAPTGPGGRITKADVISARAPAPTCTSPGACHRRT